MVNYALVLPKFSVLFYKFHIFEDFPALSSTTTPSVAPTNPAPPAEKPAANGESATTSKEPAVQIKRGSGDGDHLEAKKQPKSGWNGSDRQPYKASWKPETSHDKQTRRTDGARPRASSGQEGDWSKYHYLKALAEETKTFKQKFDSRFRRNLECFTFEVVSLFELLPIMQMHHPSPLSRRKWATSSARIRVSRWRTASA